MSNPPEIQSGILLVAEPFMEDPNFRHSVVLLCHKTVDGSFGFVLNKPTGIKVSEALDDFPSDDFMLYEGGPVEKDTIHFITTRGDLVENSKQVADNIYWGGDFEKLKLLIDTKQITPDQVKFFIGYSGWDAGQIEDELETKSWILSPAKSEFVFETDPAKVWRMVLLNMGEQFRFIANIPENPNLN
jgi:putative transcriptional regulator